MLQFCKEHLFGVPSTTKGEKQMPTNQELLLNLIRENDNPEQALQIAINVITSYLEQSLSYQEPSVDFLLALD